jgi:hypothetical protein
MHASPRATLNGFGLRSLMVVVEVVLRHFYQSRYGSSPLWFFLWGMPLASWLLALGERGGHDDLCGSDRLSVIPHVHRRTELYCAQACLV